MKCPKCAYLGFETGDRCRNCGYDFSLLAVADEPDPDVSLHVMHEEGDVPDLWLDNAHDPLSGRPGPEMISPAPVPAGRTVDSALPLFTPSEDDDEPLIKLPVTPRPPLAVRRTPDTPRPRAVSRAILRPSPAPVLQFVEEPLEKPARTPEEHLRIQPARSGAMTAETSRAGARLVSALIDYTILLGIDLGVLYFTARMAGLSMDEWRLLPRVPMLTFLVLLKVAYFYLFTAVGGQTIGKMAVGTCVVTDDGAAVDASRAMRRTCAGALSCLTLGLGFIPALFGHRRALHDRLAGTRVVRLRVV